MDHLSAAGSSATRNLITTEIPKWLNRRKTVDFRLQRPHTTPGSLFFNEPMRAMDSRRDFTSKNVSPGYFSELSEKANSGLGTFLVLDGNVLFAISFCFCNRPPWDAVPPSSSSSCCSYSRPRRLGVRSRMMIMMQQTMTPLHASSAQRHRRCRSSRVMSLRRNSRSSSFFRKTAPPRQSMGRSVEAEPWNYPKDLTRASPL